jgi:superfamily I DNA/RNA helicase
MPMAASMSHMVASADTIPILSTLSAKSLRHKGQLLVENWLGSGDFDPTSNKIKVMTMKVSKGLEFPVVALPGVGHMPAARDEREAARVFYVAATRATKRLVMGVVGGDGKLGVPLSLL